MEVYLLFRRENKGKVWFDNIRLLEGNALIKNEYDNDGNVVAAYDEEGQKNTFTYDASGNKKSETDENDQAFDAMGRDYICRILGAPLYIDDSIKATCPCCSKSMNYVAVLTGEDYGNEGGLTGGITFQIGESFLYFYLCKQCLIIQTSMQST